MVHIWGTREEVDSGYQEEIFYFLPWDFSSRSNIGGSGSYSVISKHAFFYIFLSLHLYHLRGITK